MNATALNSGIPGGTTGKVEYRIKGFCQTEQRFIQMWLTLPLPATFQSCVYTCRVDTRDQPENGNDWDPGTTPELIRDLRSAVFNKMYYTYIYLPAGAEFKITIGRSWAVNYGGSGGNLSAGGANLTVAAAGYYRISVDISALKYNIMAGRMDLLAVQLVPDGILPAYSPPMH